MRRRNILIGALAAGTAAVPSAATAAPAADPRDEAAVIAAADGIDTAVDAKDWTACRAYFADQVDVDFSSLSGEPAARIPADQLVAGWRAGLFAGKRSHHMRSNHRATVRGDRATVESKGYALNILANKRGDQEWEVWGDYVHEFARTPRGWRCSGMKLTVVHARGNDWVRTATR